MMKVGYKIRMSNIRRLVLQIVRIRALWTGMYVNAISLHKTGLARPKWYDALLRAECDQVSRPDLNTL